MDNECRVMLDNDGKSVCRVHGEAWPCPELQRLNALVASATQVRELRPSIWPAPAGGVARRNRADLFTPAERAIYDAVHIVEDAGAHPRLTDAVILLGKAREAVADFVDGVDTPASLAVGEPVAHTWERCDFCGPFVRCGHCGNNCCNGGTKDDCPDRCASAYAEQDRGLDRMRLRIAHPAPPAAPMPEVESLIKNLRLSLDSKPRLTRFVLDRTDAQKILALLEWAAGMKGGN